MLKIYGVPFSVHTRKVIVAALAKELNYENVVVVPVNPSTLPADWARLSPTGKIPVLRDGDTLVADSTVICAYLDRAYPGRPIYPLETKDYIQALWFEEYADGTLFRDVVHPLFHETIVGPKLRQQPLNQAAIDAVLESALPKTFSYLESVLSTGFVTSSELSVADIAIVSNLVTYRYLGYPLDGRRFAKLAMYFERTIRHPAMLKALRLEQPAVESMSLQNDFLRVALA